MNRSSKTDRLRAFLIRTGAVKQMQRPGMEHSAAVAEGHSVSLKLQDRAQLILTIRENLGDVVIDASTSNAHHDTIEHNFPDPLEKISLPETCLGKSVISHEYRKGHTPGMCQPCLIHVFTSSSWVEIFGVPRPHQHMRLYRKCFDDVQTL